MGCVEERRNLERTPCLSPNLEDVLLSPAGAGTCWYKGISQEQNCLNETFRGASDSVWCVENDDISGL